MEIDKNRYEEKVNCVQAEYKEQVIYDYKDNPMIEALPDLIDDESVIDILSEYPYFNKEETKLDKIYRCHLVQRIFQYFQPLGIHLDLYNKFSIILRQGYISRNPITLAYVQRFNEGYKQILNNDYELKFKNNASGFTIVGVSGMGKTTTVNRILCSIPQVILHSKYKDRILNMYQVTWIKLECPHDGSIKALCLNFFKKIDNILNSNYLRKYGSGRLSANAMIPIMAQVCRSVNLGVLIIDEIQNLNSAKSGGAEKMLNFFLNLINEIGVPIILIGTPSAIEILQSKFRLARRNSSMGVIYWDKLDKDMNWKLLIEGLWQYQWTKQYTELTDELSDILYEESQGIIDIALKIYAMAQIKSITSTKSEKITVNLIKKVSRENFKLIKPMLDALKTGNINKIAQYEDISFSIDNLIKKEVDSLEVQKRIEKLKKHQEAKKIDEINDTKMKVIEKLSVLDIDLIKAGRYIDNIISSSKDKDVNDIVKEVLKKVLNNEKEEEKKVRKSVKVQLQNCDIRRIVSEGRKKKLSAYEVLSRTGIINNEDIFIKGVI